MTTKLRKVFESKPDCYGFRNSIDVTANFNPENNTIDDLHVWSYSQRCRNYHDITDIFETVPELESFVDNIDWNEVARQEELAKEEEVCNEA